MTIQIPGAQSYHDESLRKSIEDYREVIFVTGGCGFIGSHFVKHLLDGPLDCLVVNVDKLTYAGSLSRFADPRHIPNREGVRCDHAFLRADICDRTVMKDWVDIYQPTYIVNFAAESHVDRSIEHSGRCLATNVLGTVSLLEAARSSERLKKFVQVSTDEVYGSWEDKVAGTGYAETAPLQPQNPYAASKAAAEHFVTAYRNTYKLPTVITRGCNTFGEWQYPEKLFPVICDNLAKNRSIPIYGDGSQRRQWIYVTDHCSAIAAVMQLTADWDVFNVGGGPPRTNLWLVREILRSQTGSEESELLRFVEDRPGHDDCYWISSEKLQQVTGWRPQLEVSHIVWSVASWFTGEAGQRWIEETGHNTETRLGCPSKE